MMADSEDNIKRQKRFILHECTEEFEASHQGKVSFTLKRFVLRLPEFALHSEWLDVLLDSIPSLSPKYNQHFHVSTGQTVNMTTGGPGSCQAILAHIYTCLRQTVAVYVS